MKAILCGITSDSQDLLHNFDTRVLDKLLSHYFTISPPKSNPDLSGWGRDRLTATHGTRTGDLPLRRTVRLPLGHQISCMFIINFDVY